MDIDGAESAMMEDCVGGLAMEQTEMNTMDPMEQMEMDCQTESDQVASDNIKIYLRARPYVGQEDADRAPSVRLSPASSTVCFAARGGLSETFAYDGVGGPDVTQAEVFEAVGRPITENCLQGYNGTIFA